MDFARDVGKYGEAWRGILFRQTYKQLADVVAKTRKWFPKIFPDASFNQSDYTWTWKTGEQLLLRHMAREIDYWNYHGHEYPWIGWEEITQWRTLDCYHMMKACNRSSVMGVPKRIRATTNPFGIGHTAVKAYFIDPAPRGHIIVSEEGTERVAIFGHYSENTHLMEADEAYINRLKSIRDPNVRKAWLDGSWDIVAGGALDDIWKEDVHMIPKFEIPLHWQIRRSLDWGSSAPFSLGWHVKATGEEVRMSDGTTRTFPPGTQIRVGEFYGCSKTDPQKGLNWTNTRIAKAAKEFEEARGWKGRVQPGGADSSIFDSGTGFGRSQYEDFKEEGIYFEKAPKGPGSRRTRLSTLRVMMENSLDSKTKPGYYAFRSCEQLRRQFPILPRDPNDYETVDTDSEDHLFDEVTYELTRSSGNVIGMQV